MDGFFDRYELEIVQFFGYVDLLYYIYTYIYIDYFLFLIKKWLGFLCSNPVAQMFEAMSCDATKDQKISLSPTETQPAFTLKEAPSTRLRVVSCETSGQLELISRRRSRVLKEI